MASLALIAALFAACGGGAPAGAGKISFASGLTDDVEIEGIERSSFRGGDQFAYRAVLSEPAGATTLRLIIARVQGASEVAVLTDTVNVTNPDFNIFGNELPIDNLGLTEAGTYVMRISRDTTKLAEGTFTYSP